MRLFRKSIGPLAAVALGVVSPDPAGADPKKETPKNDKAPVSAPVSAETKKEKLDLPIPKGQPQKGLKIPLYGADGKLQMNFQMAVAIWIDDDNIRMSGLRIETFKADGTRELDLELPDANLNTRTKDLTSNVRVSIKRDDFEVTGNTMIFNTDTRQGSLGGGVRMLIYNNEPPAAGPRPGKTEIELQPTKEEKK